MGAIFERLSFLGFALANATATVGCNGFRFGKAVSGEVVQDNVSVLIEANERAGLPVQFSAKYGYHVVVVGAVWCQPCDRLKFYISQHAKEYPTVKFIILEMPNEEGMTDSDRAILSFCGGHSGCRGLPYIYVVGTNGQFAYSLCNWKGEGVSVAGAATSGGGGVKWNGNVPIAGPSMSNEPRWSPVEGASSPPSIGAGWPELSAALNTLMRMQAPVSQQSPMQPAPSATAPQTGGVAPKALPPSGPVEPQNSPAKPENNEL